MKNIILFLLISLSVSAQAQLFSLSDSTIIFKNQDGKELTKDEVREYMRGVFSIHQENRDGKKVITIIPSGNDERALQQARLDAFRKSLINQSIKSFHFKDMNGKKWDSDKLIGKIIIINFWFTACKPCIQEMPHLNALVANNNSDSIIFIAPAPENEDQIKKFLKKYSFDYNIIPSSIDYIQSMNVENFPTHLVIGQDGVIRQVFIGYADDIKEKLQAEINKLK